MKFFLGIDGGGSKTDFLVIDGDGNHILEYTIDKGCKPSRYGLEAGVAVLKDGLDHVSKELSGGIDSIYAGISSCHTPKPSYKPITDLLSKYSKNYKLSGDLYTSFRAHSSGTHGILLLAGTGSVIVHFYEKDIKYLDAICYGATEILFMLSNAYKKDLLSEDTSNLLEQLVGEDVLRQDARYYHVNMVPTGALKSLSKSKVSPHIWSDLQPIYDIVIDRWVYKTVGRILGHKHLSDERPIEVILSGGLWNFDYIRENVVTEILRTFADEVTIVFDPSKKAVDGAALLARNLSNI